ncbi:MAG: HEAT repeat domain-containing protein [Deltaproteobacteria bacterium]|nr:HEAT repeat domain-containing protein [bacterium]MCB9479957.1 HEAT repeat domain-containing protein [Deltaproteobacteria bacterium]MCB9489750.1 HEAT repeat domain-containing protein [Deltaproteobacteria bacterium]
MGLGDLFGITPAKVEKWVAERNVAKLTQALEKGDGAVRRAAVEGLAQIRGGEVLQFCKDNARSSNEQVRWAVTQILGLIGTPAAMEILGTVKDPDEELAKKAKNWKAQDKTVGK